MGKSVFFKPVSLAFAIITLIESFTWGVLSFLCILCYNDVIKYNTINMNFGLKVFTDTIYYLYLSEKPLPIDRAVTPNTFHILMWLYFILSLFLFFSSAVHISVLSTQSKPRKMNLSTLIWQLLTYTTCIYDLITCILFGVDYHLIRGNIKNDAADTEIILAVTITLLILAAKGFVLWILNLTLAIIISVLFKKKIVDEPILKDSQFKVDPEVYARNNIAYDAYGDLTTAESTADSKEKIETPENNNTWFTKINSERSRLSNVGALSKCSLESLDRTVVSRNTWSGIPRTRSSSYQTPRSLVASLSPSPVPAPAIETRRSQISQSDIYNSVIDNNDYVTDDYDDDDDDDIMSSPSYLSSAYSHLKRFTLNEPTPDYN